MSSLLNLLVLDERLRRQRFYVALLLFTVILIVGSIPGARQEIGVFASGIILHSVAYSTLTVLMFTGVQGSRKRRAIVASLAVIAMGALDELVQSALPYRVGSLGDWLVDSVASLITAATMWALLPVPQPAAGASRSD
ncbi:VanZ family protein [Massilia sp. PAMC28688]|uniref:VanZ family protein n=1 Tax=Massilia sp. PAMC28688 TaxID=2861283 RepID=UPI001C62D14C|nr:VanZ family protein [Massilia sp. PAMC28688]QYF94178.1 VanZ family protein [Massilia sp. PAMC28688]